MVFNGFMDKLCKLVFLKQSVTMPTGYYLGFSTTTPNANGGNITEPSSSAGYSRQALTSMTTAGDGIAYNTAEVDYGEASGNWGTLTWCILYDQSGTALSAGRLENSVTVNAGETLKLKAGNVKLYFGEAAVSA